MDSIPGIVSMISQWVLEERRTHLYVSEQLKSMFPATRGLSIRSVERFCSRHNIHSSSRLSEARVDEVVRAAVLKVGPTYGRKTITGLLAADGTRIAEKRVGKSLERVSSQYHTRRRVSTHYQTNPIPYSAEYAGEKLHIDQNEKLVMYGCTHVCAVDGRSGAVVGFATMAIKNNIIIYENFFKNILLEHGIWDQVRVDHGREWYLMLSVQQSLAHLRNNTLKSPFIQTTSKQNHRVERLWSEVNTRVNYPIKAALNEMMESNMFSLDNSLHFYCISTITRKVAYVGFQLFVRSWNYHPIPGRSRKSGMSPHIPTVEMSVNNRTQKINPAILPTSEQAVQEYQQSGGHLTDPAHNCIDPLNDETKKCIRESTFNQQFPSLDNIFHTLVNGNCRNFKDALLFYIDVTYRLVNS